MNAPRLSHDDKLVIAQEIVEKAKALLHRFGKPVKLSGGQQVSAARIGDLEVMMITPFSGIQTGHGDFRYQVNIWRDGGGKVFAACWEPKAKWANEFECFRLVNGDWIAAFLAR